MVFRTAGILPAFMIMSRQDAGGPEEYELRPETYETRTYQPSTREVSPPVPALTRILLPITSTEVPTLTLMVRLAPSTSTIMALPASASSCAEPLWMR